MENAVSIGVVGGSPLLVLTAILFLPRAVWDSETGRYRGYFNRSVIQVMAAIAAFFGFVAIQMEKSGPDSAAYVLAQSFIALTLSRVYVELVHHHKYGIWLHKQYHKLTDHDDPAES